MDCIYKSDRGGGVGRYMSTNRVLTFYMEKCESWLTSSRRLASLDIRTGPLGTMLSLYIFIGKGLDLPVTVGRYLLTNQSCPHQTSDNDFGVLESKYPGCFVFISRIDIICLFVRPGSYTYVCRPESCPLCCQGVSPLGIIPVRTILSGLKLYQGR